MSDDGARGTRRPGAGGPPANVAEALERARRHARAAALESVSALGALLDAASLAATGSVAEERPELALVTRVLTDLAGALGAGGDEASPLLDAVADALDAEIARWETRAAEDPDARAVLRAWLGLRELLWELGVRRRSRRGARPRRAAPQPAPDARAPGRASQASPGARRRGLQRVPLEG